MATNNTNKPNQSSDHKPFNKLTEVYGDLFSCPLTHSMAHCISADVKMGQGIAVTFKNEFGGVTKLLEQRQTSGGLALLERNERFIYYLVTKESYWHKPTYNTLQCSLVKMKEHNLQRNVKNVCMPKIGCGIEKLDWNTVSDMINDIYKDTDIQITVYNYGGNKHGKGKANQGKIDHQGQPNQGRNASNYLQQNTNPARNTLHQPQGQRVTNPQPTRGAQEEREEHGQGSDHLENKDHNEEHGNSKKRRRKNKKKSSTTDPVKLDRDFVSRKEIDTGYFNPFTKEIFEGQDAKDDKNGGQQRDHKGKGDKNKHGKGRDDKHHRPRKDTNEEKSKDHGHHSQRRDESGERSQGDSEREQHGKGHADEDHSQRRDNSGERCQGDSEREKHGRVDDSQGPKSEKEKETNPERKQTKTENDDIVTQDQSEKNEKRLPQEELQKLNFKEELREHGEDNKASGAQKESQSEGRNTEDVSLLSDDGNAMETTQEPGEGNEGEVGEDTVPLSSEERKMRRRREKKKRQQQNKNLSRKTNK